MKVMTAASLRFTRGRRPQRFPNRLTAAHKTLPLGARVKVTNKKNGKSVVVRIDDRGPYVAGRIIDLTPAGARALGMDGLAPARGEADFLKTPFSH